MPKMSKMNIQVKVLLKWIFPNVRKKERKRLKITGTIPDDLFEWGDKQIKERAYFRWSHLIEVALTRLKEEEASEDPKERER